MSAAPQVLNVYLNDALVGTITQLPGTDQTIFVFDEGYLNDPWRPTLSLAFKGGPFAPRGIAYEPRAYRMRVHPFFSNLLPEGRMREYLAERNNVHVERELFLLRALGEDLPGAVVVKAAQEDLPTDDYLGVREGEGIYASQTLKFSLAGVQLKFSAVQKARGGLTIPAYGRGGSWIIKLPSERFEAAPENEYAMMRVAARAGFDVPPIELVSLASIEGLPAGMRKDGQGFAIRRFDRDAHGRRIHIEDFAQVFGLWPRSKYDKASNANIARVIWDEIGPEGLRDLIARLVFNAAIGNGDMHVKNWSLIYPDGRTPQLAPAYDYLSTLTYVSAQEGMALSLAGTKSFQALSEDLLAQFAKKGGWPVDFVITSAREAVTRTLDAWSDMRSELGIPNYMVDTIEKHMRTVPIVKDAFG